MGTRAGTQDVGWNVAPGWLPNLVSFTVVVVVVACKGGGCSHYCLPFKLIEINLIQQKQSKQLAVKREE